VIHLRGDHTHMPSHLMAHDILPADLDAVCVGRLQVPGRPAPVIVATRGADFVDLSVSYPTMADLLDQPDPARAVAEVGDGTGWPTAAVVEATLNGAEDAPRLLSPIDLQVVKAAGVTFATSMIERVIEERTKGDRELAEQTRARIQDAVGASIEGLEPGSPAAARAKEALIGEGLWSQYLEVGIGPDPEIFTKAPVLSSVGLGAEIGVLSSSGWNNPEPEVVLAVSSDGRPVGATLGNDVNLRDIEGRSALLLGKAKDNNASCAIGPIIRLFNGRFSLDDVAAVDVHLSIVGEDGFELDEVSSMRFISRRLRDLVASAYGSHHQYPDGFVLFTGTMFAPTKDRDAKGEGFTHHRGDVVTISTPRLGALVNTVTASEDAAPWTFGIRRLMAALREG
jgi:fumarylacetoacetate (FAA) hydrolase family protein